MYTHNMNNSKASEAQAEENLRDKLSDHLQFKKQKYCYIPLYEVISFSCVSSYCPRY